MGGPAASARIGSGIALHVGTTAGGGGGRPRPRTLWAAASPVLGLEGNRGKSLARLWPAVGGTGTEVSDGAVVDCTCHSRRSLWMSTRPERGSL